MLSWNCQNVEGNRDNVVGKMAPIDFVTRAATDLQFIKNNFFKGMPVCFCLKESDSVKAT